MISLFYVLPRSAATLAVTLCCLLLMFLLLSATKFKGSVLDGVVGSEILFVDEDAKIWELTIEPRSTTPMHRHNCNYYFVVLTPMELEVYVTSSVEGPAFTFFANGTMGFRVEGDDLVQIGVESPIRLPRTHAARNPGTKVYREILFESKKSCLSGKSPTEMEPLFVVEVETTEL